MDHLPARYGSSPESITIRVPGGVPITVRVPGTEVGLPYRSFSGSPGEEHLMIKSIETI